MSILAGLNTEQKEAVENIEGPQLVLAGAGSGKTRALTHRIAYMIDQGIRPYNIMAVTFTNKAANEMKERIRKLIGISSDGLWIGTFHSICVRILRKEVAKLGYSSNFVIYDSSDQLTATKQVMNQLNIDTKKFKPRAIHSRISNAKNELQNPKEYGSQAGDFMEEMAARVYERYQKLLKENNALDFDDLIMKTVKLFRKFPRVRDYYQDRFKYILVDEYQDTNHAQYTLIKLMADKYRNLCVVGDPDQSIYGFRGADIRNIMEFEKDYTDAQIIKLEQNYRSTERILDAAHYVIEKNANRKEKRLFTEKGKGDYISYYQAATDRDEAQFVVTEIKRQRELWGYNYSDFAILYRTNFQSRSFEDALMKNNIPYQIVGGLKFYDRMEIKDILAYLKTIYNPNDDISAERIVKKLRGVGKTTLGRLLEFGEMHGLSLLQSIGELNKITTIRGGRARKKLLQFHKMMSEFIQVRDELPVTELTDKVLDKTGYVKDLEKEGTVEAQTRIENIKELYSVMEEFIQGTDGYTVGSFLEEISLATGQDNMEDEEPGVLLMTLHTVKGLEFPVVFMSGMEESIFPYQKAIDSGEDQLEEERRLCYVGITRAEEKLYLTNARRRMVFGSFKYNPASRFIGDIPEELFGQTVKEEKKSNRSTSSTSTGRTSSKRSGNAFGRSSQRGRVQGRIQKEGSGDSKDKFAKYNGGEKVRHPKFGKGTVVSAKGEGEDQELKIAFPAGGVKTILLRYAPIERI